MPEGEAKAAEAKAAFANRATAAMVKQRLAIPAEVASRLEKIVG